MPPVSLVPDVIREIILNLAEFDPETGEYSIYGLRNLYPCIFVNREWCRITIPILWQQPFHFDPIKGIKAIETYIKCLNYHEKETLSQNGINVQFILERGVFGEEKEEQEDEEENNNNDNREVTRSSLMSLDFITNSDSPPSYNQRPMFNYPQYLRRLFYEHLFRSAEYLCKYLSGYNDEEEDDELYDTREEEDYEEFGDQAKLIVKSILGICLNSGAKINGLWFSPDSPYDDKDKYELLEDYRGMFTNTKVLDISCLFRKTFLYTLLSRMCNKVEHLHIRSFWSRHSEERHIDKTGEVMHSLITSQRSLVSFQLTICKAYTRIFLPLLLHHRSTLKRIKFDQVDFRGCGQWTSISQCEELELLEVIQCTNLEDDMVRPLISNDPDTGFGRNLEVRYIRINPTCQVFDDWVKRVNGVRNNLPDLELPENFQQFGEASGSNNRVSRRK